MDSLVKASVRAGIAGTVIMLIGLAILGYGWFYQRELFAWFFYLFMGMSVAAIVIAGILSGVFSIAHIKRDRDLVKPGFIAGILTVAIPAIITVIILGLVLAGGREQIGWAVFALRMLFLLIVMVAVSALLSAAYVVIVRKWSVGKKR